jgi:DtxR family Mn-dependent transcriptional regulator
LTPSEEEYLESIFMCEGKTHGRAKVKELADDLDIKAPSVVEMLRKLKRRGLVDYDRSGAKLTKRGREQAIRVVRRHQLAERLLSDVFGHDLPGVHEHACEFEHVLDDELTDKLDDMLGNPSTCPHGDPIPTPYGKPSEVTGKKLIDASGGEECTVTVIPEERGSVERLLSLNILPGAKIKVVDKLPRGAIIMQCGKTQVALSRSIASKIIVRGRHPHRR